MSKLTHEHFKILQDKYETEVSLIEHEYKNHPGLIACYFYKGPDVNDCNVLKRLFCKNPEYKCPWFITPREFGKKERLNDK